MVNSWKEEVMKGVNVIDYNVNLSEKGIKAMKKNDVTLREAEDGNTYLPKGMYEISVSMNGKSTKEILEVK